MTIEEKVKLIAENMPKTYNSAYQKGLEEGQSELITINETLATLVEVE